MGATDSGTKWEGELYTLNRYKAYYMTIVYVYTTTFSEDCDVFHAEKL